MSTGVPESSSPLAAASTRAARTGHAPRSTARDGARRALSEFSVLNDFRYLSSTDKELLKVVTGEDIEPSIIERTGAASAFAQQIALDRRTGEIHPSSDITGTFLRLRAQSIASANAHRPGFRNPYSGDVLTTALSYLDSVGRGTDEVRYSPNS